jgi:DNA-binding GntR family transcriptional regulator
MSELVFRFLLHGIVDGALSAGETIDEHHLAARVRTSPASLREAIKQLAVLGVVETPANGPARLASFSPGEAASEARAWAALHGVMLAEAWPTAPGQLPQLFDIHRRYNQQIDAERMADALVTNFEFFSHLRALAENPSIRAGVTATAYRLVLAGPLLPNHTDPATIRTLHQRIIDSTQRSDLAAAKETLLSWSEQTL